MTEAPTAPFEDLQSYLLFLENTGRLKRVTAPVDASWEVACVARWALESTPDDEAYALLFENITNHDVAIAVNLYYPRRAYADALGIDPDGLLTHWATALAEPRDPIPVERGPVHDVVTVGDSADLSTIPAPVWTPGRDAGAYLSAGCVITADPDTGIQNMGTYRVQIHDEKRAGLFFGSEAQHGAIHYKKYCERGEPMPVAIVVGGPPAVNFAAAAKTVYGVDEITVAGGLMGVGVETVRGKTVDLMVPSRAECVIEGWVSPTAREAEGPFGEALGYMEAGGPAPVVEVSAICHRSSPVHHGYVQQLPPSDGHVVMEMGLLGPLWYYLSRQLRLEGIRDMAVVPGSAGVTSLVVQLDRSSTAGVAGVGRALTKFGFGQKYIFLVDDDIDIHDAETVNWAVSSRVDPARDITIIDDTKTFQLDPSVLSRAAAGGGGEELGAPPYRSSMAVIDATLKGPSPDTALPSADLMQQALDRWGELGLPPIRPRRRIEKLLDRSPS